MYSTPQCLPQPGTPFYVDLDPVLYSAAAKADNLTEAAGNVVESVRWLRSNAAGLECTLVYTPPGSRKGGRRLIASRQTYQGQRAYAANGLVSGLRVWLTQQVDIAGQELVSSGDLEADDLIAEKAHHRPVVLWSPDKDLRQIDCIHFSVDTGFLDNSVGEYQNMLGEYYGERWFWQQMLCGDRVDNIPSVGVSLSGRRMGPAEASKLLDGSPMGAWAKVVFACFKRNFGEDASKVMSEQLYLVGLGRPVGGRLISTGPVDNLSDLIGEEYDQKEQELIRRRVNEWGTQTAGEPNRHGEGEDAGAAEGAMWDLLWQN